MQETVRRFVELITRGDYEGAVAASNGKGIDADFLREEVEDNYGFELVPPPSEWWERVEVIPIDDSDPPRFAVAAPLWEPDGESDLMLELELTEVAEGEYEVEIDGCHVM